MIHQQFRQTRGPNCLVRGDVSFQRFHFANSLAQQVDDLFIEAINGRSFGKSAVQADDAQIGWIGKAIIDRQTGKTLQAPSPRAIELSSLGQEFPHLAESLDAVAGAYDAYAEKRSGFDDPEDLMRLLRGAGVLEYRIAVRASKPEGVNPDDMREQLAERGPENTDSPVGRWFLINDLQQWYDGPEQLAALQGDPVNYFARPGLDLVAGERDGKYYLLLYITDNKTWAKVGQPLSDALTAAYKKAGKPENLVIIKDDRDANGALKGDPQVIAKFIAKHRLPKARPSFTWRYFSSNMNSPLPIQIGTANYTYDPDAELSAKAGSVKFSVKLDKGGESEFVNVVNIEITEAENLTLYLHDGFVNLSFPVTVIINGQTIHDKVKVKRDWDLFISDILPRRFFMLPIVGLLECEFKHKPQFVKKKAKKAPGEAKAAGADDDPKGAKDGK